MPAISSTNSYDIKRSNNKYSVDKAGVFNAGTINTEVEEVSLNTTEINQNLPSKLEVAGATATVVTNSVSFGLTKVGEHIIDGLVFAGDKLTQGVSYLVAKGVGLINEDAGQVLMQERANMARENKDFMTREFTDEAEKDYYENSLIGKRANEASNIKYDSETAQKIKDTTEKVGTVAAATTLTVASGGTAAAFGGFLYGSGMQAEKTYQQTYDTGALQEAGIVLSGALNALSWYANGKIGASFLTNIISSVGKVGLKKTGAVLIKSVANKEFVKAWLTSSIKDPGNYIGTAMMSAGDVIGFFNGEKELNAENIAKFTGTLLLNFGINVLEDGVRMGLSGFRSDGTNEIANDINEKLRQEEIQKKYAELKKYLVESLKFDDNNELENRTAEVLAYRLATYDGDDPSIKTIIDNFENIEKKVPYFQIGIVPNFTYPFRMDGTIGIGDKVIKESTDEKLSVIITHELGHLLYGSVKGFEDYHPEKYEETAKEVVDAMDDARNNIEKNTDEITLLIEQFNKTRDGLWDIANDQVTLYKSDFIKETEELLQKYSDEDAELESIAKKLLNNKDIRKYLEKSGMEDIEIADILSDKELLKELIVEQKRIDKTMEIVEALEYEHGSKPEFNETIQSFINNTYRKREFMDANGNQIRIKVGHNNDYFEGEKGLYKGFNECMADYFAVKLANDTKTEQILRSILGDKIFDLMDSYYKEVADILSEGVE